MYQGHVLLFRRIKTTFSIFCGGWLPWKFEKVIKGPIKLLVACCIVTITLTKTPRNKILVSCQSSKSTYFFALPKLVVVFPFPVRFNILIDVMSAFCYCVIVQANMVGNSKMYLLYRPFSHCIDQAGLGAFTAKSGRKHYNPPPLTVM